MALGLIALANGPETALLERFDKTRAYIRRPATRSIRPYYQRITDKAYGNRTLPRAFAQSQYYFTFDLENAPAMVYLNLFIDEFVVAVDGSLTGVSPDQVSELAASSGIPTASLSRRPWGLLPLEGKSGTE